MRYQIYLIERLSKVTCPELSKKVRAKICAQVLHMFVMKLDTDDNDDDDEDNDDAADHSGNGKDISNNDNEKQ